MVRILHIMLIKPKMDKIGFQFILKTNVEFVCKIVKIKL